MDDQHTSMEELKVDEEESFKEASMEEDILGAQSLLVSDSDEEGDGDNTKKSQHKSPLKRANPEATKITNVDNLSNVIEQNLNLIKDQESLPSLPKEHLDKISDEDEQNVNVKNVSPNQTTKRILDSDEEDTKKESTKNIEDSNGQNVNNKFKKISKLIDSESESDDLTSKQNSKGETKTQKFTLLDSDSDIKCGDEEMEFANDAREAKRLLDNKKRKKDEEQKSKTRKQISTLIDSDSEIQAASSGKSGDEEMELEKAAREANVLFDINKKKKKKKKNSKSIVQKPSLIGSDSEDEADSSENSGNEEVGSNNKEKSKENKKQKTKIIRASAKKAMDEMQAIQSEQQRLHREAHISIPYHKPKKHSLQDFLNRKTVITPNSGNSPVPEAIHRKSLKMTQEELEEYAKLMEERAKEAQEFFKSESEDEDETIFMDNKGVMDSNEVEEMPNDSPEQENEMKEPDVTHDLDEVRLTEEELAEILAEENKESEHEIKDQSTPKVLITEVIELPKLDMNTVNISPVKKPKRTLNVKEILKTINFTESPSISGDPNKLIDLETGDLIERKPSGVENLMQRLMATVKAKKNKNSEKCSILSTENGKLEMTMVNVSLKEDKDPNIDPKPGAAYFELKKNLKEIIKKKRLEELHKKQGEELDHEEGREEDQEESETEEYEPESKPNRKMNEIEIDEEENAVDLDEEDDAVDEGETNDVDNDDDDDDEENSEENIEDEENADGEENDESSVSEDNDPEENNIKSNTRKNRIIKAFDDSDEENENRNAIDLLKPQISSTSQLFPFESQSENNAEIDENELLGLCSGTFDSTQAHPNALMSQIPVTQNHGKSIDDDVLMELCSGTFDDPVLANNTNEGENSINVLQPKGNKIFSSDEEDPENVHNNKRNKKLTKKQKKNVAKLEFSDDENEVDQPKEIIDLQASDEEVKAHEEDEAEPETFIDYDSEENEVVVQLTKKERVKRAENFLENEAELSESEWGSADEDEKNLDKYDIELGDEDEFDKEKLRSELEQIHARKMLDEDLKEVRKIQEMLFEDEEKDGVGRQRQFRWKNAENGFSLEDGANEEKGEGVEGDSGDEITEHQWRKIRFEREQFLKEQGLKPGSQDMSTTLSNTTLHLASEPIISSTVGTKKMQIITKKTLTVNSSSTNYSEISNPFLISKGVTTMHKKSVRGSFLVRDKETLQKLAGITKGAAGSVSTASDLMEAAGTVSIKGVKAQNFVFVTLTEEEHQSLKRRSDDLLNSSNENGTNFMKKPKIEPRREKCFIDQLL